MRLLKLFFSGIISIVINAQAMSVASLVSNPLQDTQMPIHAASTNQVSRNWSGYAATNGTYTSVTGTWQIPKTTSRKQGIDATWVGIGGVNSEDLIQAGTQTIVDETGEVMYEAFYEVLPDPSQPVRLAVHEGDFITSTVLKKSGNTWQITLENSTTGAKTQLSIVYSSSLSSADWIEEAPSGERNILPLDDFGTVHFSSATAVQNDEKVTLEEANAQAMHMGENMGQVLAVASVVGKDGQSFSVSRTKASVEEPETRLRHGFGRLPFYLKDF